MDSTHARRPSDPDRLREPTAPRDAAPVAPVPLPVVRRVVDAGDTWDAVWGVKVQDYLTEQESTLKKLFVSFPGLQAKLGELRDLLRAPTSPASASRAKLKEIIEHCRTPQQAQVALARADASGISSFPTTSVTNWLEYVNAKVLWQRDQGGDRDLLPGGPVATTNKVGKLETLFPDYLTPDDDVVGDHVRVAKPSADRAEVAREIAKGVKDKLTTYPAKQVRVVVDVGSSSLGTLAPDGLLGEADRGKATVVAELRTIGADIRARIAGVVVVFGDDSTVDVTPQDVT